MSELRVLVGVDGSENALKAVKMVADLVSNTGGNITLLHVIAPSDFALFSGQMTRDMRQKTFGEERMEAAISFLMNTKIKFKTVVKFGNPAEVIVTMSKKYDLVVVGSRGLSQIGEFLMGGVSSRVVTHSKVPVLVVH
jgi:nucleotide-binding universal stress UspA family protein